MKHKYFGDITDYKKYSILRFLSNNGKNSIFVVWMLTPDDESNDGRHITYLTKPEVWREYEPDIFDSFVSHLADERRSLKIVEDEQYISNAVFNSEILKDDKENREHYIQRVKTNTSDIIFLDPDNGMEVASVNHGKKGSSRYVYWHELKEVYETGSSVLVYQHFARVKRDPYVAQQVQKMKESTSCKKIVVFRTSWAAFFLLLQDGHEHLVEDVDTFAGKWGEEIICSVF